MPEDTRDLRDPEKLGEWLLNRPTEERASKGYDVHSPSIMGYVPRVPKHGSLVDETAAQYRRELEEQGIDPDKLFAEGPLDEPVD